MYNQEKSQKKKIRSVSIDKSISDQSGFYHDDNRPESIVQRNILQSKSVEKSKIYQFTNNGTSSSSGSGSAGGTSTSESKSSNDQNQGETKQKEKPTKEFYVSQFSEFLAKVNKVRNHKDLDDIGQSHINTLRTMVERCLAVLNGLEDDDQKGLKKTLNDWKDFRKQYFHCFGLVNELTEKNEKESKDAADRIAMDKENEERRLAKGKRAEALRTKNNTAIQAVVDAIDAARKIAGQEEYNAGDNDNLQTEGGNSNPLKLDWGDKIDAFTGKQVVSGFTNSDSGPAKVVFNRPKKNILVHVQ